MHVSKSFASLLLTAFGVLLLSSVLSTTAFRFRIETINTSKFQPAVWDATGRPGVTPNSTGFFYLEGSGLVTVLVNSAGLRCYIQRNVVVHQELGSIDYARVVAVGGSPNQVHIRLFPVTADQKKETKLVFQEGQKGMANSMVRWIIEAYGIRVPSEVSQYPEQTKLNFMKVRDGPDPKTYLKQLLELHPEPSIISLYDGNRNKFGLDAFLRENLPPFSWKVVAVDFLTPPLQVQVQSMNQVQVAHRGKRNQVRSVPVERPMQLTFRPAQGPPVMGPPYMVAYQPK